MERFHKYLTEQLRIERDACETNFRWVDALGRIAFRYNAGFLSHVKETPFYLMFRQDPNDFEKQRVEGCVLALQGKGSLSIRLKKYPKRGVQRLENTLMLPGVLVWWLDKPTRRKFDRKGELCRVLERIGNGILIGKLLSTGQEVRMGIHHCRLVRALTEDNETGVESRRELLCSPNRMPNQIIVEKGTNHIETQQEDNKFSSRRKDKVADNLPQVL